MKRLYRVSKKTLHFAVWVLSAEGTIFNLESSLFQWFQGLHFSFLALYFFCYNHGFEYKSDI